MLKSTGSEILDALAREHTRAFCDDPTAGARTPTATSRAATTDDASAEALLREAPLQAPCDLIVQTDNPEYLDQTVQQLGAAVVVDGSFDGETCRVRVLAGDPGFIRFAIDNQGYGVVVGEEPCA